MELQTRSFFLSSVVNAAAQVIINGEAGQLQMTCGRRERDDMSGESGGECVVTGTVANPR